jgi:glycogen(starch) synthase
MTISTLQIGMGWFAEFQGGLNRVYASLIPELQAQGVDCTGLVTGTGDVARMSHGLVSSYAPTDAPLWRRLFALRRAAAPWLASHDKDSVIVSHFAQYALPILDHARRRPFVVHFQGPWGQESLVEGHSRLSVRMKESLERVVYRAADAAIVLSSPFGNILAERFGVDRDRIHVIPGGVDARRFAMTTSRVEARGQLGWPADRPTVVCVRRLVKRVGIELLVDAAVELRRECPDVLIQVIGTGPLRGSIAARIAGLGLSDTVKLVGFLAEEQLPLAYRAADVSVVPTIALEGFGLVTAESLAAGTPCVVTPVDGLREIMSPFAPQLITDSATSAAIGDKLSAVLRSRVDIPSAEACADYARSRFDWPVIARQVKQVYESVA